MCETSQKMGDEGFSQETVMRPEARPLPGPDDFLGKRRMAAAIDHLNQEILSLQEELQELETTDASSMTCKEVISNVESKPDGLLPRTKGPANAAWDRWFQGAHLSRSHKWWTQKQHDFS
ncbi:guanine nucleotide-binding protein subunit gamma 2-like [Tasmannia lanceolata]|uniref:guanine nucleotide-binding protein subunit gamma 2-like n=1 Tax=Tasmannia lanceolata TaxID=3420 RepID=UPI0040627D63